MRNPRCRWVRDRLPLLAGDDLVGPDRRRVESHLVGCPGCRRHLVAFDHALRALETASASSPARPDAPSLWPDLARQIRESRRPHRGPTFDFDPFNFRFDPPRVGFWPAFGLLLGMLATVGAMVAVRKRIDAPRAATTANATRSIAIPMMTPKVVEQPRDPAPRTDLPSSVAENVPPQRFQDESDPAPITTSDPRDSKLTY
jgi:anti-sigma factor RsiW